MYLAQAIILYGREWILVCNFQTNEEQQSAGNTLSVQHQARWKVVLISSLYPFLEDLSFVPFLTGIRFRDRFTLQLVKVGLDRFPLLELGCELSVLFIAWKAFFFIDKQNFTKDPVLTYRRKRLNKGGQFHKKLAHRIFRNTESLEFVSPSNLD